MRRHDVLMAEAGEHGAAAAGAGGGGGSGGAAGAGGGAAGSGPAGASGSVAGSVLTAGAAAPAGEAGASPAGASDAAGAAQAHFIPEKYLVKAGDAVDLEASAKKLADGYAALAKRLGGGDLPPASPDEYAPKLPEGLTLDTLKADPQYQSFAKSAHARGITNEQLGWVLAEYQQRQQAAAPNPERAFSTLQKEWGESFPTQARNAYKALSSFGATLTDAERAALDANPVALKVLAQVGAQMAEDVAPIIDNTPAAQSWDQQVAALRANPAFTDANHPEHAIVMQKLDALYARRYDAKNRVRAAVVARK